MYRSARIHPFSLLLRLIALLLAFLSAALLFIGVCYGPPDKRLSFRVAKPAAGICINFCNAEAKTVILDAGHGGFDGGAQGSDGIWEKDLNLVITKKLASFLSLYGIRTILTRTDDELPAGADGTTKKRAELLSRIQIAQNNAHDLFLSVHMNSFPQENCAGTQVFFSERNLQNEVIAVLLQKTVAGLLQPNNTRCAKPSSVIFLLERLEKPAVLVECGFISNSSELALLETEIYQNKLAFALATGIASYFSGDYSL